LNKGPQRGEWEGQTALQASKDVQVWLAKGHNNRSGLLKIALTSNGQIALAREAILLNKVDHPQVPSLLASGDERKWLTREYVEGQSLQITAPRPLGEAVDIAVGLADILSHLHEKGLVHADLKPDNIIVDPQGHVHLLDFGIACVELSRAKPGHFKGTLGYAAPEQLQGQPLQSATDIYALGTILYQLITGRLPFETEDPSALAYLPLATLPEAVSTHRLGLPAGLSALVMTMLARDPVRRPATGPGLGQSLRASAATAALPAIIGMPVARASLRSLVSVAVRGQGGVVVVYGADGSGRQTLINEAIRGAVQEGLPVGKNISEVQKSLNTTLLEEVVLFSGNATDPDAVSLASRILADRLPCLLFLRSNQPLAVLERRGARHVVPGVLTEQGIGQLLEAMDLPDAQAGALWRRSKGHPGQVHRALELQTQGATQLSPIELTILKESRDNPIALQILSEKLMLGKHATVDLAERLVDLGLLKVLDDGKKVQSGQTPTA
jgi:hypothetical protein